MGAARVLSIATWPFLAVSLVPRLGRARSTVLDAQVRRRRACHTEHVTRRLLSWTGLDDPTRVDHASVELGKDWMRAISSACSQQFTTCWELDVASGWQTWSLHVTARGFRWSRTLELTRSVTSEWSAVADHNGTSDLPDPGLHDASSLTGATDCDLGLCPLTNTMPIRRLGLLDRHVARTRLVMALVEVPSLRVLRSDQL